MPDEKLRIRAHVDGGARGNPGPAGAGIVLRDADDDEIIHEAGLYLGRATNNVAEYRALLYALETAAQLGAGGVDVFSDSQLMVRQMTGEYRVRNAGLKPLFERAQELAASLGQCTFTHVRREENTEADRLVNEAVNAKRNVDGAADG